MSERVRICLVSDYSMTTLGGAETAFFEQSKILGEHFDVTVMSADCARLTELGTFPGVSAVAVPIWFRLPIRGLPVARNSPKLLDFFVDEFRGRRIQIVHIHTEFAMAATALAAARILGLPVVHTIHTFFWQINWPIQRVLALTVPPYHQFLTGVKPTRAKLANRPGDSALRNMTLAVAAQVDATISPSVHQARWLAKAGISAITVIPNSMGFPPEAQPITEVDTPIRVLWIGRFVAEKRILPFLRSARDAIDRAGVGRLQISVVGDGEEFRAAKHLVRNYPDIQLLGRVSHQQVQELIAKTHVTALTSVGWDNQPMVIVESIVALRGVVYCDPALTEGLAGPGLPAFGVDEARLTERLVSLVTNPETVVAASADALSAREEFAIETFVSRTGEVYRQVLRQ